MEGLPGQGTIEVITGSMFSGKTEELLRRINLAHNAGRRTLVFKPSLDTRSGNNSIVSHDQNSIPSIPVEHSSDILAQGMQAEVIGIDEAQFFDTGLTDVSNRLASMGVRVIIAGLDMDFNGSAFGPMPLLMAICDELIKLHACCAHCGRTACYSYRLNPNREQIMLGAKDTYEPRCRHCFHLGA